MPQTYSSTALPPPIPARLPFSAHYPLATLHHPIYGHLYTCHYASGLFPEILYSHESTLMHLSQRVVPSFVSSQYFPTTNLYPLPVSEDHSDSVPVYEALRTSISVFNRRRILDRANIAIGSSFLYFLPKLPLRMYPKHVRFVACGLI